MAIIILAFVPVFALTGQEGKLFHPLAFTKTFAMVGSTLLAVTLVPVLCSWLVRGPFHSEEHNVVMRFLLRVYDPALNWALNHRKAVIAVAAAILGVSLIIAFGLPRIWVKSIRDAGYPLVVLWNVDPADWRVGLTGETVAAGVVGASGPGAIVLLHLREWSTFDALPAIVDGLRANGLMPVRVGDFIAG